MVKNGVIIDSSAADMARFYDQLFQGKVFENPPLLSRMLGSDSNANLPAYRYGILESTGEAGHCYSHNGFWGTEAFYDILHI